ncbi:hypothetical protein [Micromonospora chalcea]|uniref:hypothetical protein n=1 Tax=Micromonospora chalcea TaxID=1874 RepID=UPI003D731039
MRSTLTPAARAAAGARLMDQHDPQWYHGVDLALLDIDDPDLCVIGQTEGDFYDSSLVPWALGTVRVERWAVSHGFRSEPSLGEEDDPEDPGDKAELEKAWHHEITMRRNLAPFADVLLAEASA